MSGKWYQKKEEIKFFSSLKERRLWEERLYGKSINYLYQLEEEQITKPFLSKYFKDSTCIIIGVGSGGNVLLLKDICRYIIGIDIASSRLVIAKKMGIDNCEYLLCDAENLPLKKGTMDTLICYATLHHLPNVRASLDQMFQVLRKDGVILLREPGALNPFAYIGRKLFPKSFTSGERAFKPFNLRHLISSKFTIVHDEYLYVLTPALIVLLNKIPKKFLSKEARSIVLKVIKTLDGALVKTVIKELCWVLIFVAKK